MNLMYGTAQGSPLAREVPAWLALYTLHISQVFSTLPGDSRPWRYRVDFQRLVAALLAFLVWIRSS